MLVLCSVIQAGTVYENSRIDLRNGTARPAVFGEIVFSDQFTQKNVWNTKVHNYENLLKYSFDKKYKGSSCFYISGQGLPKKDTAWCLYSNKIPFTRKHSEFTLCFTFSTDQTINGQLETSSLWRSAVLWFDAAGSPCGEQQFSFIGAASDFSESAVYGNVPEQAKSFVLQFGFDRPNLDEGKFFALHSVLLSMNDSATQSKNNSFEKADSLQKKNDQSKTEGCFVSEIFPGGPVSWKADIPAGTSVRFQISSAPSVNDIPGKWSEFTGPDGTKNSYYEKPFTVTERFVRYKVFLKPNGMNAPTLYSVQIGSKTDSQWTLRRDAFPPRVKVVSQTPTKNKRNELVLSIVDDAPILWSTLKITLDGKNATDRFHRKNNLLHFIPESDWNDGLHKIDVEISDYYNNSVQAKKCFFIGTTPTTSKVTMREDGAVLIDGKPFFPIGIYGVMKREFNNFNIDKAFADLKDAGFNFAHSYIMPREDEFLDTAQKYGFKLWTVARFPDERFINTERNHPAILAWYLGDDTSANTTPSELFDRNDAVKALDPTRLTTQADPISSQSQISNYQDYVRGTDTFLPEIYPVHTKKKNSARDCVPITILDMKRCQIDIKKANDGPKSIWPIIQYFQGWGWERFPTMQELRAMSFASIIHGANGITWYTYGGTVEPEKKKFNYGVTTTPERWNNISTVARQIRDLSPVLLERTPVKQPSFKILSGPALDSLKNDSISLLLKTKDGSSWLLTVNSSIQDVQAEFDLPGSTQADVLYENRSLPIVNGKLTDKFKGLDVHLYKIK